MTKPGFPKVMLQFIAACDEAVAEQKVLKVRYDKFLLMAIEPHRQQSEVDKALSAMGVPNRLNELDKLCREKSWEVYLDQEKKWLLIGPKQKNGGILNMGAVIDADYAVVLWEPPAS